MANVSSLRTTSKVSQIENTRIVELKPVAQNQWSLWLKIESSSSSRFSNFLPGQFCMLSLFDLVDPLSARPFAIVEMKENEQKESLIRFIFRVTGKFTHLLTKFNIGARIGLMGPLGKGFDSSHFNNKKIAAIAGGAGYASLLPILFDLKEKKSPDPLVYYGIRTDLEIIRQGPYSARYASDDGSIGYKGRIHDFLKIEKNEIEKCDAFIVCGPSLMMKSVYDIIPPEKTYYFLEEAMGCGFGICLSCMVTLKVGNQAPTRIRSCLEGPIFKGDELSIWRKES